MTTQYLHVDGGTIAYETFGAGHLVICASGMGDLRSGFDEFRHELVPAGFRVVQVDLRGHGDSSTDWPSYTVTDVANDLLALIENLDAGPVILVGNSFSAGAAVVAAATKPDAVRAVALLGPFLAPPEPGLGVRASRMLLSLPIIGRIAWTAYWPKFFGPIKPTNFRARRRELKANMAQPGRFDSVVAMMHGQDDAGDRGLPTLTIPILVVMGAKDPDFADPEAVARDIVSRAQAGSLLLIDNAGHYPQATHPQETAAAVGRLVRSR